ncbi:MAG TPA: prolyl oligopeptidase family serine peptidase [Bryobacteraceae bacterium]|nr:prolyl oligopeptidase family serine peptidase [Bryobacteraceae bacterium]
MVRTSLTLICFAALTTLADEPYQKPPREILEILNAPATPRAVVSPAHTHLLLTEPLRYPPIAVVGQPMLRLAGLRINPKNNGPHRANLDISMSLLRIDDGSQRKIDLPAGAKTSAPVWSPDGRRFAFTNTGENAIELWVGDVASGRAHKIEGVRVNAAMTLSPGPGQRHESIFQWMPDSRTLLVQTVPANRGAPPAEPAIPIGVHTQEAAGHTGPVRTYEDMLSNAHDEDLFEYYATAQLAAVDTDSGRVEPRGKPAIFLSIDPAPDGEHVLVARVHRPFSYLHPVESFPKEVEVWDRPGSVAYKLASLPLEDRVPIDGVPTGPRNYVWRPTQSATLVWVEALDGGNPKEKAAHRDRILMLKAPFRSAPEEIFKTEERFRGLEFSDKSIAFVQDYERNRRWQRMFAIDVDHPETPAKLLWGVNVQDRYHSPGTMVLRTLANGHAVAAQSGDDIYLAGAGASPEGDRPFLDRLNLATGKTERLFRSSNTVYESVVAMLDDSGSKILTARESKSKPPNYFVRGLGATASERELTRFPDPTPQLRGITKQKVTYKRADGVPLSFTLYLPPGYKPGTRLPTVVWAYPLEYNDADTAGQISGSVERFTTITGPSELFFALHGYAVLDDTAMPIIGNPETVNNTYIEQIVMDAKAAIDKAVGMGVTDRDRVGVGGHSYGAFMTANLLAHSNLFRAGIARSGAYNRTLTPFGFQTERRTLWEAPEVYLKMSPFLVADKIKAPILMTHGEADDNTGTFPIQSARMYQAIRGNGGTVRLVMLPAEAHGYQARETIETVLSEMMAWFDKYVRDAPRGGVSTQ